MLKGAQRMLQQSSPERAVDAGAGALSCAQGREVRERLRRQSRALVGIMVPELQEWRG